MQLRPEGGISNIYNNMSRGKRLENNMKVLAVFSFHRSLKFSYFVPRDLVIQLLMIYLDVGHSAFYVRGKGKKRSAYIYFAFSCMKGKCENNVRSEYEMKAQIIFAESGRKKILKKIQGKLRW